MGSSVDGRSRGRGSNGGGSVVVCHNVDDWKNNLAAGVESKKLVVVDFTASWCGPCRMMTPVLVEWAKKYDDVLFLKVDVDELKQVSEEWEVEAMPTFVFLKEGKTIDRMVGARKEELHNKILQHKAGAATATI